MSTVTVFKPRVKRKQKTKGVESITVKYVQARSLLACTSNMLTTELLDLNFYSRLKLKEASKCYSEEPQTVDKIDY